MVYFFHRQHETLTCETRLDPDGVGFQLVVTAVEDIHVERFDTVAAMLAREHELLQAWKAQGWQEVRGPRSGRVRRASGDSSE